MQINYNFLLSENIIARIIRQRFNLFTHPCFVFCKLLRLSHILKLSLIYSANCSRRPVWHFGLIANLKETFSRLNDEFGGFSFIKLFLSFSEYCRFQLSWGFIKSVCLFLIWDFKQISFANCTYVKNKISNFFMRCNLLSSFNIIIIESIYQFYSSCFN